jgi:outer membrane protein assembly factor BamA
MPLAATLAALALAAALAPQAPQATRSPREPRLEDSLLLAEPPPSPPYDPDAPPGGPDAPPGEPAARPATATEEAPVAPRTYLVERVAFTGLSHVREWAVRRHLIAAEGAPLDEQRVLVSRLRLMQLGWFSSVETRVERGSARGLVVLVFDVVERNTLVISDLVIGGTPTQPLYGGIGLTQQNLLGQGLSLSGAFAWAGPPSGRPGDPAAFAARSAFFAPDVGLAGRRFQAGASAVWLRGEELTCQDPGCDAFGDHKAGAPRLRYQRAGGEATVGVRTGPFERVTGGLRLEWLRGEQVAGNGPAGPAPYLLPGRSLLSALSGTWEHDDRDDLFFPTEGMLSVAQVTFSSRLLGSDYEYSRYLLQGEGAFGLLGLPLRLQLLVGAAQGDAPFFERFYGADLSYFAVGPALGRAMELNHSTDSRYDAFAAMAGLEYGLRLWGRGAFFHRGYLALGARAVWSSATLGGRRTAFSSTPASLEAALRLDTPVGTFNATLGALLDVFL